MGYHITKLNYRCNANCLFCADAKEIRMQKDPDLEVLYKELKQAKETTCSVIISGGEPTISAILPDYLDKAKELGYREIMISTNGLRLVYNDYAQNLVCRGVNRFIVSFQTTDADAYDKITGVPGSLGMVSRGMQNVMQLGAAVATNTVIHKLNYKSLAVIAAHLIDAGVSNVQFSFMNPCGQSVVNGQSTMAVSMTEALPYVLDAINTAEAKTYANLYIENMPICVLGRKDRISDLKKENKEYYNQSKAKPEKCRTCRHFEICDGVWRDYLKQFGEGELNPQ